MQDQKRVACAFNANHCMAPAKYVWHLARCPDKKNREAAKFPIYYCKFNRLHIFLNIHAFNTHEKQCEQVNKSLDKSP